MARLKPGSHQWSGEQLPNGRRAINLKAYTSFQVDSTFWQAMSLPTQSQALAPIFEHVNY